MAKEPKPWPSARLEERFAYYMLQRAFGVTIFHHDDGSADGMVDGIYERADGRTGAVEVTTLAETDAMRADANMFGRERHVEGARWAWLASVGVEINFRELDRHLPALVLTSEADGVLSPELSPSLVGSPALQWYRENDVTLRASPESERHGAVDLIGPGYAGAVDYQLAQFPSWLSEQMTSRQLLVDHLAKLERAGADESHLFLRVHDSGIPESALVSIAFYEAIPSADLEAPDFLTTVWIVPAWKSSSLWWERGIGWQRRMLVD